MTHTTKQLITLTDSDITPNRKEKKPKKKRCAKKGCHKKLNLIPFICSCKHSFCAEHRLPEFHECSVDYKKIGREQIRKNNPLVINSKINVI